MTAAVYPPNPAMRMADIEPFHVMEMMARAAELERQGRDIIHMEVGEPDFTTAEPIIAAGMAALRSGQTHYTLATGRSALKEAVAHWYQSRYRTEVPARRILITVGASGALQSVFWSLLNPGDEVLLGDPGYPCNQNFVRLADAVPILLPTRADNGWKLTADQVRSAISPKTRALLIASPNNPTGTVMTRDELTGIAAICRDRGVALIVDEIYSGLIYDLPDFTACELGPEVFVINSFSKYFGMTGWRLGWVVCPETFIRPLEKLAQNLFISPPTMAQHAAEAAFLPHTIEVLEQRRQQFRQRRDFLLQELPALGFKISRVPDGAFYLFLDIRPFGLSSQQFSQHMLEHAGVAITPGIDFSQHYGNDYVRLAYTTELDRLQQAIGHIGEALTLLG